MGDLWVFGYGSLMWNPGFAFAERVRARMHGAHRALCLRSITYRGTPERPGLVLGLDRGGACTGVAFRVEAGEADGVLAYLREREMINYAYREVCRPVRLIDGRRVSALAFMVRREHPQYAGRAGPDEIAAVVAACAGQAGPNRDYVLNTLAHLRQAGIRDPHLEAVAAHLTD